MDAFCLVLYGAVIAAGLRLVKRRGSPALPVCAVMLAAGGIAASIGVLSLGASMFGVMRALAWGIFLAAPVGLFGAAWLLRSVAPAIFALPLVAAGLDAFFVEPRWLEVSHHEVQVEGLAEPTRVVLVADLQTDRVGDFEREALATAMAQDPDLLVFSGDYLQVAEGDFAEQDALFRAALVDAAVHTVPFVAVEGDIDRARRPESFEGLGGEVVERSRTLELAGLTVTALQPDHSRDGVLHVPEVDGPHVVVGHAPDYALTDPPADVLLAGHTHGGQVQLPGAGPLLTLTMLPPDQAHGYTELDGGQHLFVSRGLGLERRDAPRMRFFCRPELVVIDLVATPGASPAG